MVFLMRLVKGHHRPCVDGTMIGQLSKNEQQIVLSMWSCLHLPPPGEPVCDIHLDRRRQGTNKT